MAAIPKSEFKRNGFYVLEKDGKQVKLPSVTSILTAVPKPQLIHWAATLASRAALEDPTRTEDECVSAIYAAKTSGASRGSLIHSFIEATDNGASPDHMALYPEVRGYALAHRKFVSDMKPKLIYNEQIVVNISMGYAGQLDRIYEIGGKVCLVDYKTSKEYYKEMGLQLGAYRDAEFIFKKQDRSWLEMPKIDRCFVVLLKEDGTYGIHEGVGDLTVFMALKQVYEWLNADKLKPVKINKGGTRVATEGGDKSE